MDVTKTGDNERVVGRIIENEGRIDVLINNAGFGLYGPVEDIPINDARYQFEVNLFGLAHLTQLVLPHMRAHGSGRIVNISSMVGKIYAPLGAWYHATKHALEGWSDSLRLETAPFNIQVVLIEPGAIKTEFGGMIGPQLKKYLGNSAYQAQPRRVHRDDRQPAWRRPPHRGRGGCQGVRQGRNDQQATPEVRHGRAGATMDVHQEVAR